MQQYSSVCKSLQSEPKRWLITGVAGFIGSHLLQTLLELNQTVVGLDNFSTGKISNLDLVKGSIDSELWKNFDFIEGDITSSATCAKSVQSIDYILHQAALGSVPRSIISPIDTHTANCNGFVNLLYAAKEANISSFTYASSSAVYGDHIELPKVEDVIGNSLSPYAVSKYTNELYASVFAQCYNYNSIGLRYFNVFGSRQDPRGAYAAVVPRWEFAMRSNQDIHIYGDGETTRDFCFVDNVVQANILSAVAENEAKNQVYNIALGDQTSLNELFQIMKNILSENLEVNTKAIYEDFREGDIRHSNADITKAKSLIYYDPQYTLEQGLRLMLA